MLPFPGRTPAQLASQHLHARPRLSSLSPADQAVIGKALSKKPQDRFPSCRAMVENLIHGPSHAATAGRRPVTRPAAPAKSEAAAHRPRPGSADADAPQPRSDGDKTQVFDSESHRGWTTQPAVGTGAAGRAERRPAAPGTKRHPGRSRAAADPVCRRRRHRLPGAAGCDSDCATRSALPRPCRPFRPC